MVFVTAVRDYIDFLNHSFSAFGLGEGMQMSTQQFIQQTVVYLMESCKVALLYIFTLQWLRDFAYLPIIIPQYVEAVYKEALFLGHHLDFNFLTFGETPTIVHNKFFVGFFNSLFACLPFSCAHLVALRRFYLQGWPVAFATSLGIISGHLFFLTSVLFGWRALLFPWLHFEPWNYIIGLLLITGIVYNFGRPAGVTQHRSFTLKDLNVYLSMGTAACVLTLCEQGVIFQHLTTFTVGLEPSFMEPLSGTSHNLVLAHSLYILGFILGSLVFTFLSYGAALGFRFIVTQVCLITEVRFHMHYQRYSRFLIMGIAVTTVPFYGLDYFVTNPLGFVPYDTSITLGSIFAPNTLAETWLKEQNGTYKIEATKTYPFVEDFALAGFDRGNFFHIKTGVQNPDNRKKTLALNEEDFVLPVEHAWQTRSKREIARGRGNLGKKHRASIMRAKTWLTKVLPSYAESEQNKLERREERLKRAASANTDLQRFAARAKRDRRWVPEQFNQFTILDNYTFGTNRYKLPSQSSNLKEVLKGSSPFVTKKGDFEEKDFEKIDELDAVMDAVNYSQTRRKEAASITSDPRFNSQRKAAIARIDAPRHSLVQNFEERVYRHRLNDKTMANGNWAHPLTLFNLNAFLPEEVQAKHGNGVDFAAFQAPFRGPEHRKANRKFRKNIFYKTLMRTDIDLFLNRQPKHHFLSPSEEAELYFKRTMLSDYYNSMRQYKDMENGRRFVLAYGGTKSLAHKVYNHQFRGSYRIARRLFSVDLRPGNQPLSPEAHKRVMKYDQPLYDETKSHNPMLHEELQKRRERVNQILQGEAKGSAKARRILREKRLPFFRTSATRPLYCGWDEKTRQFVLTNRYLPRVDAGEVQVNTRTGRKALSKRGQKRFIQFTSWPIKRFVGKKPVKLLQDGRYKSRSVLPVQENMTEPLTSRLEFAKEGKRNSWYFNPEMSGPKNYFSRPADYTRLRPWKRFKQWPAGIEVVPKYFRARGWYQHQQPIPFADRGGFVWPGHEVMRTTGLPKKIRELGVTVTPPRGSPPTTLRDKAVAFYELFT